MGGEFFMIVHCDDDEVDALQQLVQNRIDALPLARHDDMVFAYPGEQPGQVYAAGGLEDEEDMYVLEDFANALWQELGDRVRIEASVSGCDLEVFPPEIQAAMAREVRAQQEAHARAAEAEARSIGPVQGDLELTWKEELLEVRARMIDPVRPTLKVRFATPDGAVENELTAMWREKDGRWLFQVWLLGERDRGSWLGGHLVGRRPR